MSDRTDKLKTVIETAHHCAARHIDSTPVFEAFQGQVIWEGVVDTFSLFGHPVAKRCYAWPFKDDAGAEQTVTVLEIPPVNSPETAVKIAIASGQITPA
jgi:hypothetical protein